MRRVVRWSIALGLAFSAVTMAAPHSDAAAPSKGCVSRGTTQGFGTVESDGTTTVTFSDMRLEEYVCQKAGTKHWLTVADSPAEIAGLREWATSGWRHDVVWCEGAKASWLVSSMDEYSGAVVGPRRLANYQRWAPQYAKRHGCEVI